MSKDYAAMIERVNTSPYYNLLGFYAEELSEGYCRMRMPAAEKLKQFQGHVHGGAIFSIADAAVAVALLGMCEPGEKVMTVEAKLNHLAPVEDDEIYAEAKIIQKGKSVALGDVEVRRSRDNRIVAKGLVTYMVRK